LITGFIVCILTEPAAWHAVNSTSRRIRVRVRVRVRVPEDMFVDELNV